MRQTLIITHCYPPCDQWASSSRRMAGFARYLPSFGWRAIILNCQCSCYSAFEHSENGEIFIRSAEIQSDLASVMDKAKSFLSKEADKNLVLRVRCQTGPLHKLWLWLEKESGGSCGDTHFHDKPKWAQKIAPIKIWSSVKFFAWGLKKLLSFMGLGLSDRSSDWQHAGQKLANALVKQIPIDVVISSAPYQIHHELAVKATKQKRIPWVADQRDALFRIEECQLSLKTLIQYGFLRQASLMIHVTPQEAKRDQWILPRKNVVIENGFLEEEMAEVKKWALHQPCGKDFVLRYLGYSFYRQPLDLFFQGLRLFWDAFEEKNTPPFWFEYYGMAGEEIERKATQFKIRKAVRIFPQVKMKQAFQYMVTADALVLPLNARYPGCPGGKFYEYLASGRPILAAGTDEYVSSVLEKTASGEVASSAEEVAAVLKRWFYERQTHGRHYVKTGLTKIDQYSRKHGAGKLADQLNELMKEQKSNFYDKGKVHLCAV